MEGGSCPDGKWQDAAVAGRRALAYWEEDGNRQVKKSKGHTSNYGSLIEYRVPISGHMV